MEDNRLELFNEIELGEEGRIKSIDLIKIINHFRKLEEETGGKKYRELKHKDFMKKIRKETETLNLLGLDDGRNFSLVKYTDQKGEERPCYSLNRDGMMEMLNSESVFCRHKTIEYINKLEEKVKELKEDNEFLIETNEQLYSIAVSEEELKERQYEADKVKYGWRNLKIVLNGCTYKNIADEVDSIIEFHCRTLKKKDRQYNYDKLTDTEYKQVVRDRLDDILTEIYCTTHDAILRTAVHEIINDKVLREKIKTINRVNGHKQ